MMMSKTESTAPMGVSQACFNMVENQLKPGGVRDFRLTHVMKNIPRNKFISATHRDLAFADCVVACQAGDATRQLLSPLAFALLAELAAVQPDDVVLDIAGGTGYAAAVLANLATTVIALEGNEKMSEKAGQIWQDLGISNVVAVTGALPQGQAKQGPFNVIFINGLIAHRPDTLLEQLDDGGRLVCVQPNEGVARAHIYKRFGDRFAKNLAFDIAVPALPEFAAKEEFKF